MPLAFARTRYYSPECVEGVLDLPAARGMRRVVATFANERGDVAEMTDVSTNESECVLQEPTQIGLKGRVDHPGFYELKLRRFRACLSMYEAASSGEIPRCAAPTSAAYRSASCSEPLRTSASTVSRPRRRAAATRW